MVYAVEVEQGIYSAKDKSTDTEEFSDAYNSAPFATAVFYVDVTTDVAGTLTIDIQHKATRATQWATLKSGAFSLTGVGGASFTIPEVGVDNLMAGQVRLRVTGTSLDMIFSAWVLFRP